MKFFLVIISSLLLLSSVLISTTSSYPFLASAPTTATMSPLSTPRPDSSSLNLPPFSTPTSRAIKLHTISFSMWPVLLGLQHLWACASRPLWYLSLLSPLLRKLSLPSLFCLRNPSFLALKSLHFCSSLSPYYCFFYNPVFLLLTCFCLYSCSFSGYLLLSFSQEHHPSLGQNHQMIKRLSLTSFSSFFLFSFSFSLVSWWSLSM